jgi:uncharacterized repeat protein (TIGR01451 family)
MGRRANPTTPRRSPASPWLGVGLACSLVLAGPLIVRAATPSPAPSGPTSPGLGPDEDPDIPPFLRDIDKETYLRLRDAFIGMLRGFDDAKRLPYNPRQRAIEFFERQPKFSVTASPTTLPLASTTTWTEIGPRPIPNGQTQGVANPVTGRMTALEIDPTNTNRLYLGTASGGVWRSLDGGTSWTPIFDSAQSLSIGALALAPSDPTILYVGTGEANGSLDSFAGVGLYRIDAAPTTATLVGPINPIRNYTAGDGTTLVSNPVFNGRSISRILVHPTDPTTLFVGTAGGVIGEGGDAPLGNTVPPLGMRGLYRLGNATGTPASVTVVKLAVTTAGSGFDTPNTGNRNVSDLIFPDPADPNQLVVWIQGTVNASDGGIYRSSNALAAPPTFSLVQGTTAPGSGIVRGVFAGYKQASAPNLVIYSAAGESVAGTGCTVSGNAGALRVSIDGGLTWSAKLAGGGGFCGGQCFYNFGFDVRPGSTAAVTDDLLWLGGNVTGGTTPPCARLHAKSTDGGATFTDSATGLHPDTHFIKVDPSNPMVVYHGNDGGIFKSTDGGASWVSLNNSPLSATQFQSVSTHSADPKYSIGGTQDNGTNMYTTAAAWNRIDFGDGGYARIDQSSASTSTVTLYHTYFNQTNNLLGFARVNTTGCATDGGWSFKGHYSGTVDPTVHCDGATDTFNGISLSDSVNFYAPVELGPGNPNTVYFGSDRLYRSADRGDTAAVVSQGPITANVPINTIAISRKNDNFRIVGLGLDVTTGVVNGHVWATTTGSSTLTDVTTNLPTPLKHVLRVIFDPNDATGNTAYVSLGGYWGNATGHVYKTTNLTLGAATTWSSASGSGLTSIPDVPVNGLAIDPFNSNHIFAGTDIGVYYSADGGASWNPLGSALPRVPVFELSFNADTNPATRILRVATHGRGLWELIPPPAATADLSINKTDGQTTVVPGNAVTYTIVATNAGPDPVTGATVTDTLPAALMGVTWTCAGASGGTCTASGAGNVSDLVNLPMGASVTYTVSGTVNPAATGTLVNTATVTTPPGVLDPNSGNNSATHVDTLTPQADLSVTKTKSDGLNTAVPGTRVFYMIVVANTGPSSANGAAVTDTLPAALTGATWTCAPSGGVCNGGGAGNINDVVFLPPGTLVTYTLTGIIDPAATGSLSNTVTVSPPGGETDPNPGNNTATHTDTLTPQADLSITKTDGRTTAVPGTRVTYTIVAVNNGPSTANGTFVTDALPAALLGATWTCVGASGGICTGSGAGNINDVVNLPSGASVTYTLSATIDRAARGTLTNTAGVAPPNGVTDPNPGNNTATDTDALLKNERPVDFDGDGKSDLTVFHGADGLWYIKSSLTNTVNTVGYGGSGYVPVAADYDGDGKTDLAVYHPPSGLWFIRSSSTGTNTSTGFGGTGYAPVRGDFDGDAKTDLAVFHDASGLWFIKYSSTGAVVSLGYGGTGYIPVPGDYDGDGKTDIAVYHPPTGLWFIHYSSTGTDSTTGFGGTGYAPVRGDFDGDGKNDLAVFHDASGLWFIKYSSTGAVVSLGYGASGYIPVPGDYDGDGKTDIAVYHPPTGLWFIRLSSTGADISTGFGGPGFTPIN